MAVGWSICTRSTGKDGPIVPLIAETERYATPVYEYLASRREFDAKRIGVMALSLGGYYAPRAASLEPRYAACVAWGAQWDYYATWDKRIKALKEAALPVPAEHLLWATGTETYEQALSKLEGFKSGDVAGKVTVPFLLMHGEEDAQVSRADADKLFAAIASKDKTMRVFTAAEGGAAPARTIRYALDRDDPATWSRVGRNAPCPCGSGKKFKVCHGTTTA